MNTELGRTDQERIKAAFKELRQVHKYSAHMGIQSCCPGCVDESKYKINHDRNVGFLRNVAPYFYHQYKDGNIPCNDILYLHWAGDANLIVEVLQKHGVSAYWNGEDSRCIAVTTHQMDWRHAFRFHISSSKSPIAFIDERQQGWELKNIKPGEDIRGF